MNMNDYSFGDIYDCRNAMGIDHYILVLGCRKIEKKEYILYEKITSRVYKAFSKLSKFFDDNCIGRCEKFKHNFKDKSTIHHYGKLCFTLFLDKTENYLEEDSMIVIKGEPVISEKIILNKWKKEGLSKFKDRISDVDVYKLIAIINHSDNLSVPTTENIRASFNQVNRMIKDQNKVLQSKKKKS